jgi:hypothetical protein
MGVHGTNLPFSVLRERVRESLTGEEIRESSNSVGIRETSSDGIVRKVLYYRYMSLGSLV